VALLENILLVKLRDALMISLVPSIYHYLGEVGFIFLHSVGRATITRTGVSHSADAVGRSKFGTDRRLIRRFGAAFALI
jgi:hypothetical protein